MAEPLAKTNFKSPKRPWEWG